MGTNVPTAPRRREARHYRVAPCGMAGQELAISSRSILQGRLVGQQLRSAFELRKHFRRQGMESRPGVHGSRGKSRAHQTATKMGYLVHRHGLALPVLASSDCSKLRKGGQKE